MGSVLYPAHPFLCQVYADVLAETGRKAEAVLMYQRCLALDPGNKAAREKLAQPDK